MPICVLKGGGGRVVLWRRSGALSVPLPYRNPERIWYSHTVLVRESLTVAISASEARSRLFPLIQQVNDDHVPVRISSKGGDAVL
ncbi:MAG: type II toxin-antitoxin system Phd/YefM family antitoxin, partial [Trebonia sp.]